jgi:hypothetical protein
MSQHYASADLDRLLKLANLVLHPCTGPKPAPYCV